MTKPNVTASVSAERQPTPGRVDKQGREIYPGGVAPSIKDGGLEPSYFIEGQLVGGAMAKPLGWLLKGLFGRLTGGITKQALSFEAQLAKTGVTGVTGFTVHVSLSSCATK